MPSFCGHFRRATYTVCSCALWNNARAQNTIIFLHLYILVFSPPPKLKDTVYIVKIGNKT